MRRLTPLLLCCACQPTAGPRDDAPSSCDLDVPEPGQLRVGTYQCFDQLPLGTEGGRGDAVLANAWVTAVIRQPAHALTVHGIGGGTLVDFAPHGMRDRLHEAIPLVDGGWLELDAWTVLEDGVRLDGELRALPGDPPLTGRREVTWRLDPDAPTLYLEGADGLWLHGTSGQTPVGGELVGSRLTLITDGTEQTDLGGARILDGVTAMTAVPTATRWKDGAGATHVTGAAIDATGIQWASAGVAQDTIAVDDGIVDLWLPPEAEEVRAVAPDRAPSSWAAVGEDLQLQLGPPGAIRLDGPIGADVNVRFSADGRSAWAVVPTGASLEVGAGSVEVELDDRTVVVDVPANGTVSLRAPGREVHPHWVRVALGLTAGRDASTRRSSFSEGLEAYWMGASAGVVFAANDVGNRSTVGMPLAAGVSLRRGNWRVDSFPWTARASQAVHGAPNPAFVPVESAVPAMRGGPGTDRSTLVDLAFLEAHGPFDPLAVHPDGVRLEAPGADPLTAWAAWLAMETPPRPVGPITWAWAADPERFEILDLQRALAREQTVAGTGPLLQLAVDGDLEWAPLPDTAYTVEVDGLEGLDTVWLTDGQSVLATWDGNHPWKVELDAERLLAIGVADDGGWAVTTIRERPPPIEE